MGRRARIVGPVLLAAVLLAGCSRDELVYQTMDEVNELTREIVEDIRAAEDKHAAVVAGTQKLRARQGELQPKLRQISQLYEFQVREPTQHYFTDAVHRASISVMQVHLELIHECVEDPELDAAFEELVATHDELLDLD